MKECLSSSSSVSMWLWQVAEARGETLEFELEANMKDWIPNKYTQFKH